MKFLLVEWLYECNITRNRAVVLNTGMAVIVYTESQLHRYSVQQPSCSCDTVELFVVYINYTYTLLIFFKEKKERRRRKKKKKKIPGLKTIPQSLTFFLKPWSTHILLLIDATSCTTSCFLFILFFQSSSPLFFNKANLGKEMPSHLYHLIMHITGCILKAK